MSEQALDLRRALRIAWRRKTLIAIVAAIGLLAGATYTALNPPKLSSTVYIALPSASVNMSTQSLIATSEPVLSAALRSGGAATTVQQLQKKVKARSPAAHILSITAEGTTAAQAENIASAVASSYIAFATSSANPIGKVQARLLEPATTPSPVSLPFYLIVTAGIGAIAGVVVGIIISVAVGRRDRRLHLRDEIADSVGLPVLASVPVGHPSDPAGWVKLMENYQPDVVHGWRLRKALYDLGVASPDFGPAGNGGPASLLVLSLSSDRGALAIGPQLAAFAASLGISTALVAADESDVTSALRGACAASPSLRPGQSGKLTLSVGGDGADRRADTALTVVVAVVDAATPQVAQVRRVDATVLGVSAGVVTAQEMARVAVSAADDGRRITGIFVADPESDDRTTGRLPQVTRPRVRRMPTRLTRITTEIRR